MKKKRIFLCGNDTQEEVFRVKELTGDGYANDVMETRERERKTTVEAADSTSATAACPCQPCLTP